MMSDYTYLELIGFILEFLLVINWGSLIYTFIFYIRCLNLPTIILKKSYITFVSLHSDNSITHMLVDLVVSHKLVFKFSCFSDCLDFVDLSLG